MITQKCRLMLRWREFLSNIIWPISVDVRHLYVWRVRILLLANLLFSNFCPAGMHKDSQQCTDLIKLTVNSLSGGVVALMLVAVQKDNLEVSINHAIKQWVLIHWDKNDGVYTQYRTKEKIEGLGSTEAVIKQCLAAFPWMWVSCEAVYRILADRGLHLVFCQFVLLICVLHPDFLSALFRRWVPLTSLLFFWCLHSRQVLISTLSSLWVFIAVSLSFHILTSPNLCPLQEVCTYYWLTS